MPALKPFEYVVVRVVPHVEREEFVNVGVLLYCKAERFLQARLVLDRARLAALAPDADCAAIQAHLDLISTVTAGGSQAGALGAMDQGERFRWLSSPRSTAIQISPTHGGLCDQPQAALDDLFQRLVNFAN